VFAVGSVPTKGAGQVGSCVNVDGDGRVVFFAVCGGQVISGPGQERLFCTLLSMPRPDSGTIVDPVAEHLFGMAIQAG